MESKPVFSYNHNIYQTFKNNENSHSYNYEREASNNINYSLAKGINIIRNEDENFEPFKSNSEDYSKSGNAYDINNDLVKKRSNKTIHFVSEKKNDLSQTNKIFERTNNEIYFSKRK